MFYFESLPKVTFDCLLASDCLDGLPALSFRDTPSGSFAVIYSLLKEEKLLERLLATTFSRSWFDESEGSGD